MKKVWLIALVWVLATGTASAIHWQSWSEEHPILAPEDCSLQFAPNSAELVTCYMDRMELSLDRRTELTLHMGLPLVPAGIVILLALGIGWLQRY